MGRSGGFSIGGCHRLDEAVFAGLGGAGLEVELVHIFVVESGSSAYSAYATSYYFYSI
jgi:hypothetical protein